jgi:hypothetical protein
VNHILMPEDPAFQRYECLVDALGTGPCIPPTRAPLWHASSRGRQLTIAPRSPGWCARHAVTRSTWAVSTPRLRGDGWKARMTYYDFPHPEQSEHEHLSAVVQALVDLLRRFELSGQADCLAERLRILDDSATSTDSIAMVVRELHGVVPGMGGLTDLYLRGDSRVETEAANAELFRLADQLYELTR